MRPRRVAYTLAALAAGALAACSLIDRSSDYFDPTGRVVTLASRPNATDLVLTNTSVFFRDDHTLYRVPKLGGPVRVIATTGSIQFLVSDGRARVAWQDTGGIHHCDDACSQVVDDTDAAGESIATTDDRILYTLPPPDDDPEAGRTVVIFDGGAPTTGIVPATTHAITPTSSNGAFYFSYQGRLDREARDGDAPVDLRNSDGGLSVCTIATFLMGFPPDEVIVDSLDGSFSALLVSSGHLRAANTEGCCSKSNPCAQLSRSPAVAELHTLALREGQVYHADGVRIVRFPFSDLADGGDFPAAAESLPTASQYNVQYLAVDDAYAFFISRDQVQRLTLTK